MAIRDILEGKEMIYACESCKYLFKGEPGLKQCPDCGKKSVRPADLMEIEEYKNNHSGNSIWEAGEKIIER